MECLFLRYASRVVPGFLVVFVLSAGQTYAQSAYVQEGDRVEARFRTFRNQLDQFYRSLRSTVEQNAPSLLPELQDAPPQPVVFGYQLVPRISDSPAAGNAAPIASFSYSWPITQGYIDNEGVRLARAQQDLRQIGDTEGAGDPAVLLKLIGDYRNIVTNQGTIDQYIQYNRFWQRSIAQDRSRFDQMTKLYEVLKSGLPAAAAAVQQILGKPDVPSFVGIVRRGTERVLLRVPLYTDIEDQDFLAEAKQSIEGMWRATEAGIEYAIEVDMRRVPASQLYRAGTVPRRGDHLDLRAHTGRFPDDGAVLTTGAEATHSLVGRYVALGPGDLSSRTLAHEFGHLLGFRDGYIRGYQDLGERGFEILELTSVFDDIMTAPRQGNVRAAHFKLILDELR